MQTIETKSHVGADGMLELKVATEVVNTDVDVVVVVTPRTTSAPTPQRDDWKRFVEKTMGSIDDASFTRPEQGEIEEREHFT